VKPFSIVASLSLLIAGASITKADPDLWGHVRFGLDTLHSHRLAVIDPYSFTQDRPWLNHEWLSEMQMGVAYRLGGPLGLSLLKGLLVFGALAILWTALRKVMFETVLVIIAVVAIGTVGVTYTLRPQLWSLLALSFVCLVLAEHRARARRWLPVLFVFWANVHGGWIVGLGVLAMWGTIEAWRTPETRCEWILVLSACGVATLYSPKTLACTRFAIRLSAAWTGCERVITPIAPATLPSFFKGMPPANIIIFPSLDA
jgi:hypothetical protein